MNSPHSQGTSLQRTLDEKRADFEANAPEQTVRVYIEGVEQVREMGVIESAMNVGDIAPDFTLPHATGEQVNLAEKLKSGPVVLTWYRGGWCPYCNIQLQAMQEILPQIEQAGATLIAISPETPDNSLDTQQKNDLEFYVVSDIDNRVARNYGIVYTVPEPVLEQFAGRIDISAYNGNDKNELPLSATYVIAPDGTIRYAFIDPEYRNRAEPAKILEIVQEIQQEF